MTNIVVPKKCRCNFAPYPCTQHLNQAPPYHLNSKTLRHYLLGSLVFSFIVRHLLTHSKWKWGSCAVLVKFLIRSHQFGMININGLLLPVHSLFPSSYVWRFRAGTLNGPPLPETDTHTHTQTCCIQIQWWRWTHSSLSAFIRCV